MALAKCRECSKEVSTEAKTCPHCGVSNPVKKGTSGLTLTIAGLVVIAALSAILRPSPAPVETVKVELTPAQIEAKKASELRFSTAVAVLTSIKSGLKDPSSVQWSSVGVSEKADVVCIEFRAKNSFGALELENLTFVKGKPSKSPDVWNKNCTKTSLFDEKKAQYSI